MANNSIVTFARENDIFIHKDGSVDFTGNQSMGGNKLTNIDEGVDPADAVNVSQLDGKSDTTHTIVSHNDTSATGGELNTLTDGVNSNADTLHKHDQYIKYTDFVTNFTSIDGGNQIMPNGMIIKWARSAIINIPTAGDLWGDVFFNYWNGSFPHNCRMVIPSIIAGGCDTGYDQASVSVGVDCFNLNNCTISWQRHDEVVVNPIRIQYFAIGY